MGLAAPSCRKAPAQPPGQIHAIHCMPRGTGFTAGESGSAPGAHRITDIRHTITAPGPTCDIGSPPASGIAGTLGIAACRPPSASCPGALDGTAAILTESGSTEPRTAAEDGTTHTTRGAAEDGTATNRTPAKPATTTNRGAAENGTATVRAAATFCA